MKQLTTLQLGKDDFYCSSLNILGLHTGRYVAMFTQRKQRREGKECSADIERKILTFLAFLKLKTKSFKSFQSTFV